MAMKAGFPSLDVRLLTDWSSGLHQMMDDGVLDAAILMLQKGVTPPYEFANRYVTTLDVVAVQSNDKPLVKSRTTVKSLATKEWILNPLGCGYRAALERAMDESGRGLRLSVDTHRTDMQLRLVSAGLGLGLVPKDLLARSPWKDRLAVVDITDFKLSLDVWLVFPHQMGNFKRVVQYLGDSVLGSFRRHSSESPNALAEQRS
jgi:DNA-binding transcriptional LysR family regulator